MAEKLFLAHHTIAFLCHLCIFLGISPVLTLQIGTCLESIDHIQVGSENIFALVISQQLLSTVKVSEDEIKCLIPCHTWVVLAVLICSSLCDFWNCKRIFVNDIRLGCIHSCDIQIEHSTQCVCNTCTNFTSFDRIGIIESLSHEEHIITVFNPSVVECPWELCTSPVRSQICEILIPCIKPVVGTYRHNILSLYIAYQEECRISKVEYVMAVSTIGKLSCQVTSEVGNEIIERTRSSTCLVNSYRACLRVDFFNTACEGERCRYQGCCHHNGKYLFHIAYFLLY